MRLASRIAGTFCFGPLAAALPSDRGDKELAFVGEGHVPALVVAQVHLRDGPRAARLEERRVGQGVPVRLVAGVGAADALVEAAQEPAEAVGRVAAAVAGLAAAARSRCCRNRSTGATAHLAEVGRRQAEQAARTAGAASRHNRPIDVAGAFRLLRQRGAGRRTAGAAVEAAAVGTGRTTAAGSALDVTANRAANRTPPAAQLRKPPPDSLNSVPLMIRCSFASNGPERRGG